MNLSNDVKRDLKRSFRDEQLARAIHKGTTEEFNDAMGKLSKQTGLSVQFLESNITDIKKLSFDI